ncbi:MAG TPA: alpha/beta hydrolase [Solirubrobacteraceae bacterium]|jgi:pimeloyl-ACP methyl ester carboxylesterase|nr:alpha/beta hydrolase [Solirubrobacteraceae bacterium]
MVEERTAAPPARLWGELRYSHELLRLLSDRRLRSPARRADAQPVFLIPGLMAGDASLTVLRSWLARRGHRVRSSGMRVNVDCSERILGRLQEQLQSFSSECGQPVVLIGQSRGGSLARVLAVRSPDCVSSVVMLGSPVREPLAVAPSVLQTVRWLARLGDLGLPGVFSSSCRDGACCASFREDLLAALPEGVGALAVHSRSDGIVDWRACLDPHARHVEVESSHCGMSVHPAVFRVLDGMLDLPRAA